MKECPVCCRCFPDQVNHCPGDGELLKNSLHGDTVVRTGTGVCVANLHASADRPDLAARLIEHAAET